MIIFLYPVTIPAWITVTAILLGLAILSLWPLAWLHERGLLPMDLLTRAAKALPDWAILSETHVAGRMIEFCATYWLGLLLVGFVVFSLLAHTLLPR